MIERYFQSDIRVSGQISEYNQPLVERYALSGLYELSGTSYTKAESDVRYTLSGTTSPVDASTLEGSGLYVADQRLHVGNGFGVAVSDSGVQANLTQLNTIYALSGTPAIANLADVVLVGTPGVFDSLVWDGATWTNVFLDGTIIISGNFTFGSGLTNTGEFVGIDLNYGGYSWGTLHEFQNGLASAMFFSTSGTGDWRFHSIRDDQFSEFADSTPWAFSLIVLGTASNLFRLYNDISGVSVLEVPRSDWRLRSRDHNNTLQRVVNETRIVSGVSGLMGGGPLSSNVYLQPDTNVLDARYALSGTGGGSSPTLTIATSGQVETRTLLDRVVIGAAATYISPNIPATYDHLRIIASLRSMSTSTQVDTGRLIFNNDITSGNYLNDRMAVFGGGTPAGSETADMRGFMCAANGGTSGNFSRIIIDIPNYALANVGRRMSLCSDVQNTNDAGNQGVDMIGMTWNSTAAISGIKMAGLTAPLNQFATGSTIELWGLRKIWVVTSGVLGVAKIQDGLIIP